MVEFLGVLLRKDESRVLLWGLIPFISEFFISVSKIIGQNENNIWFFCLLKLLVVVFCLTIHCDITTDRGKGLELSFSCCLGFVF